MIYLKKFNEAKKTYLSGFPKIPSYEIPTNSNKKDRLNTKSKPKKPSLPKTEEEILLDKIKSFCTRSQFQGDGDRIRYSYKINPDKSISVDGDVKSIPMPKGSTKIPFKFDRVKGSFYCSHMGLTTLENTPNYVGGDFDCSGNNLKTLIGGPQHVGGNYFMQYNKNLKDVYGFPQFFYGDIADKGSPIQNILSMVPSLYDEEEDDESTKKEYMGRFINLLNEYQVIRGTKIVYSRLLDVIGDLNIKFKGYEAY